MDNYEANEWKETVRNIFDLLLLNSGSRSTTDDQIMQWIALRHKEYFYGPEE
jgi:hypothetical protein